VTPGEPLAPGQIYNSNQTMLQSLVSAAGWEAVPFETVADTFDATRDALQRASDEADIIVTTGGVSVGEEDHIRDAIQSLGQLNLWRMAIKPGKPLAFGHIGDTPILGLPGNPAAVLVTFLMLGRPFLRCCQGKVVRRSRPPMHCHWALRYPGLRHAANTNACAVASSRGASGWKRRAIRARAFSARPAGRMGLR